MQHGLHEAQTGRVAVARVSGIVVVVAVVAGLLADGCAGCAPPVEKPPPAAVASAPIRRLTQEELNHTLRDLFTGVDVPFVALNDGEAVTRGASFDGDVARQTPSDLAVEQLRTGMNDVAKAAVQHRDVLLAATSGDVHGFLASFLPLALRRPAEQRELDVYTHFYDQQLAAVDDDTALELTLQGILQSPRFVYRVEIGTGRSANDGVAIEPYEMASRLSYFLWSSMPDAALFDAAAHNALTTPDSIEAQARRMLSDPRAHDAVLSFHRQWLDLDRVLTQNKDSAAFPQWNDALRRSMRTEADRMIEDVIFGDPDAPAGAAGAGDAKLRTLLTTTKTRVDASLAAVYGVPAPAVDWDPVELPADQRAGLLTNAAFLASRAHQVFGSPVLRGVFVLDRFLCESPPPPPPDVNTNPPDPAGQPAPTTNRDRFANHTFDTSCQGCHATIDGIGFGLEGYDAIGQFRTTDNNLAVDDSGHVDGADFHGGPALAALLAASPTVHNCVAKHWLTFARGRTREAADVDADHAIEKAFDSADGDIKELLVAIVKQPAFRTLPRVTP